MISNFKCYCRQYLNMNGRFYVEIRNQSTEYVHVIFVYSFHGKEIVKPTSTFGPGKIERILFPSDALAIFFQVFRSSLRPPIAVCTKYVPSDMISRFKVEQLDSGAFTCTEI